MPPTTLLHLPTCVLEGIFRQSRSILAGRATCRELYMALCVRAIHLWCSGLGNPFSLSDGIEPARRRISALVRVCRHNIIRRHYMGCTLTGVRYEKNLHNIRKYHAWRNHTGQGIMLCVFVRLEVGPPRPAPVLL